ncbi:hypothetical protein R1flu_009174 [Riccia fluitans]|uniref:Major facilitator superfamily (MFS) profile domain-containing protein n=1 Tax=Riccia fluitans TaxID=41844 RepID=A0ABD1Z4C3_9MARC
MSNSLDSFFFRRLSFPFFTTLDPITPISSPTTRTQCLLRQVEGADGGLLRHGKAGVNKPLDREFHSQRRMWYRVVEDSATEGASRWFLEIAVDSVVALGAGTFEAIRAASDCLLDLPVAPSFSSPLVLSLQQLEYYGNDSKCQYDRKLWATAGKFDEGIPEDGFPRLVVLTKLYTSDYKARTRQVSGSRKIAAVSMGGIPQRYVTVLLTFFCSCVCYIERVGFSIAYTAAASSAGVADSTKGHLLSAFYYGYASSQVPGGWAAQRFGGRRVLLMSFILWSVTSALTPTDAENITGLIIARLLVGIAQGFIFPSIHTVLAQWVPPHERSRSVSLATSGMYFGAASGMLFLPNLVAKSGPRAVFLAEATMGAVWALLWLKFSQDPPGSDGKATLASTAFERAKLLLPVHNAELVNGWVEKPAVDNGRIDQDLVAGEKPKARVGGIPWKKIMLSWRNGCGPSDY